MMQIAVMLLTLPASFFVLVVMAMIDASVAPNITYQLSEDTNIGVQIGNVMTDSGLYSTYSAGDRSRFTFNFVTSSSIDFLSVDRTSGVLRVSASIDRSALCPYADVCQLSADILIAPIFQVVRILVVLLSANRHSPTFPVLNVQLNVTTSTSPNTMWTLPEADDPDGGINGVQEYRLVQLFPVVPPSQSADAFTLSVAKLSDGSDDVRLRLTTTLEPRVTDLYNLSLTAVDGGSPPRTGSLVIVVSISDVVSDGVQFANESFDVELDENAALTTLVTTVTAGSRKTDVIIAYSFDEYTRQQFGKIFAISNETGKIFVVGPVDAELNSECLLTIVAVNLAEPGSLPVYARVIVHIRNVNDNPPRVSISTLSTSGDQVPPRGDIADGAPIGSFIAYVGVSDSDSSPDVVQCSINSSMFRLERLDAAGDYQLTSGIVFGRAHGPLYPVAITCQDGGDGRLPVMETVESLVVVVVHSGPRFPLGTIPTLVQVAAEVDPPGTAIARFNATSADVGPEAEVAYALSPANQMLSINSRTGTVSTNLVFGPETINQTYGFTVTATDMGIPPLSANTTLVVRVIRGSDVTIATSWGEWNQTGCSGLPTGDVTVSSDSLFAVVDLTTMSTGIDSGRDVIVITASVTTVVVMVTCLVVIVAGLCFLRRRVFRKPMTCSGQHPDVQKCTANGFHAETSNKSATSVPDVVHHRGPTSTIRSAKDAYSAPLSMTSESLSLTRTGQTAHSGGLNRHHNGPNACSDETLSTLRFAAMIESSKTAVGGNEQPYSGRTWYDGLTTIPRPGSTVGRPADSGCASQRMSAGPAVFHWTMPQNPISLERRSGDPSESDSGCSGSLPDSGRPSTIEDGAKWLIRMRATSTTTTSNSDVPVENGSYSPMRAAQFRRNQARTGSGRSFVDQIWCRTRGESQNSARQQLNLFHSFSISSCEASPIGKRVTRNMPLTSNCDTYV